MYDAKVRMAFEHVNESLFNFRFHESAQIGHDTLYTISWSLLSIKRLSGLANLERLICTELASLDKARHNFSVTRYLAEAIYITGGQS